MKGIVFTEFLEMVEHKFSFETMDTIIEKAQLPSGGAYTAVGTYDHMEMVSLVSELHKLTDIPESELLKVYGQYLFGSFVKGYPMFFEDVRGAFEFLESIHSYIHVEVLKLYPDAELPSFKTHRPDDRTLIMHYDSERRMGDFAEGLIMGCLEYFNEKATITKELKETDGSSLKFIISLA